MDKIWQLVKPVPVLAEKLSQSLSVSLIIAQVLLNRGVKTLPEAEVFLKPTLKNLRNPFEIPNIVKAAERVLLAKEKGEKVLIYGDYDVDGVTGTTILVQTLRHLGIEVAYYIPDRYGEGYSLSIEAVKKIADSGVKLIVTVDCGIASVKEVDEANRLGLEVVVTDHHNIPQQLPNAYALVNPKLIPNEQPSKYLSGSGVAFKFAWALLKVAKLKDVEFLTSLLDLAALGTFSDVVPLNEENRVIAVGGLKLINERKRLGIKALAEASSLKDQITENQIYFGLAPRINAAGRIEHASKSVELFLSEDADEVQALAAELNKINTRRQGIGKDIREEVFERLKDQPAGAKVVVLEGEGWHPGVIGIVASRVVDQLGCPAVLIGINDGVGRGSARSIGGVNIYALLDSCRDLFLDFGGHEGAAGFEVAVDKIPELKKRLQEKAAELISDEDLKARLLIDAELEAKVITMSLAKELSVLGPYGEGNRVPIFVTKGMKIESMRAVGADGRHLKAKFAKEGNSFDSIGFGLGEKAAELNYNNMYDIAYRLETNLWNGFESVQLSLVDIKEANK
ncbi:single-stranded-DNA-specific exonuclease RecJ [candidate division WOR-1 bacterium RIFOXYB2_FULL_42_35]|uniref:Single-stranded-DNA-specific exonuclease RecJ n=1 Tax=candidate division WOR-1 bacterium RIFOXYC2_FULL_41_25 TaxID=1802586 RepID=A0A1F4TPV4_UNCSA|nr:MAG: single-stranded-DNA-specific exonuclease RecJ [candidate division WOR-1 bacterium RIFOXYA2_FULL_41_14]OGC25198.1 MAG: single-stranded-DNA-specific exonuclease RecJ [candidate division WOR-1 bacterium RIFOXYB2_FULL_42_35]OGC34754.1 MAG: single-stranded-DNA-specific exonuclease RecJ [candidate division WOR-1 bacterium RIFOXYC2_FULL_41_25]